MSSKLREKVRECGTDLPALICDVEGLGNSEGNGLCLGLLATEEGVALQLLGLMVASDVTEDLVIVGVYCTVRHPVCVCVCMCVCVWINPLHFLIWTHFHVPFHRNRSWEANN